jgi:hypothetical protein
LAPELDFDKIIVTPHVEFLDRTSAACFLATARLDDLSSGGLNGFFEPAAPSSKRSISLRLGAQPISRSRVGSRWAKAKRFHAPTNDCWKGEFMLVFRKVENSETLSSGV